MWRDRCNAYGQPGDTPHDRLSILLDQISEELNHSNVNSLSKSKILIDQAKELLDGFDSYSSTMSSPPPSIVQTMLEESKKRPWDKLHEEGKTQFRLIPEMSAGGYEAVVLQHLARLSKAKNILEIGMFTGTTTVSLALLPSVERVVTLELEGYLEETNRPYFERAGISHKVDVRIGDASSSLDKLSEEGVCFDMIFIDADKTSYLKYFHKILERNLLAKGGFIAVDNVAFKGSPWVPDPAYAEGPTVDVFNQSVRDHPEVEVVMLPIEDGISLIRRVGE